MPLTPTLLGLTCSLLLAPADAQARPLAEVLRVEPGATCLSAPALVGTIEVWLGRDTVDPAVRVIEVRGDPTRADTASISIEIGGEKIERSFDPGPAKCGDLHAVVGLAVAIAVDTSVLGSLGYDVVGGGATPPPPGEDTERPPLARRPRPGEAPPPSPPEVRTVIAAALRGTAWIGLLPGAAGGGAAQVEFGWRGAIDLRIGGWGAYGGERSFDGSRLALALVGARVDVCAVLPRRRIRPRLCFGPTGGALIVRARTPDVRSTLGPHVALAVAPELRVWVTRRFALDVALDLVLPVVRPVLVVRGPDGADTLGSSLTLPPVGAALSLGAAFAIR